MRKGFPVCLVLILAACVSGAAQDPWKPYSPPCVEREDVFAFTEKPSVKLVGKDKYEITFAVKGNCDVTVGIVDEKGVVVRHLVSGVLGSNVPSPFRKNSLKQKIYWNGKDDLGRYVKEPGEMKVRVMLGLTPVFHKRLGSTSGKNIPGKIRGIAIGPDGAYVFSYAGHLKIRKFDRDGRYVCSLAPPPADLPGSGLAGSGYVEYETAKRALHAPKVGRTVTTDGAYLPGMSHRVVDIQPGLAGDRLVYATEGTRRTTKSRLYYIRTDGSTDVPGMSGLDLVPGGDNRGGAASHTNPRLAASPDGKNVYVGGVHTGKSPCTAVFVHTLQAGTKARVFVGVDGVPGKDNGHLSNVRGVACDAEGRVYVADHNNNRIQVFSPDGKYLKTIKIDRPNLVCVHKKTGAIYVRHAARVEGRSVMRVTKLVSVEDPKVAFHKDGLEGMPALDSWSAKPRLWLGGDSVTIWEERGKTFEKIVDFGEDVKKEDGENSFGNFNGDGCGWGSRTACDPTREKLYFGLARGPAHLFDLKTGAYEGLYRLPSFTDDISFDKRGHLHLHSNPGFGWRGVGRFDPTRSKKSGREVTYEECPYDYGIAGDRSAGVLPVKDQRGAKSFQDGVGANMRGDVAVQSYIYYVPKMDDVAKTYMLVGQNERLDTRIGAIGAPHERYSRYLRDLQAKLKKGEKVYFIRRRPGIPLLGATIWVHDHTGELRREVSPVVVGGLVNGVQIDEDGFVYFTTNRTRWIGDRKFLAGSVGRFGVAGKQRGTPFTGVYVKAKPGKLRILINNAGVPMDETELPKREPDAVTDLGGAQKGEGNRIWFEGAEWLYAGACPIVPQQPCSCPQMRAHLDWYKRSYVPEAYRHSFAVLDTNGNLALHVGRYANFDSAPGGRNGCKPGDTDIGITCARFISGTDNYLAFEDWGERLVVLKLGYHAEETADIGTR